MDSDGDLDVLSASRNDDTIAWYENNGAQSFSAHVISTTAAAAFAVYAADLDGDGDLDVLSASVFDDKIAWHENDGAQSFTEHAISSTADGARSVYAADMDGDGDLDVLAASAFDETIAWYENDGSGIFTEQIISTVTDDARSVFAADIDGDGDLDVLSASYDDDTIAWHENLSQDINLKGNGLDISDGDTTPVADDGTDFGNAEIGSPVTRTFTIENTGSLALTLSGGSPVSITGAHAGDFLVTAQPALGTLAPGQSTTFDVQFDPSAAGLRSATINVASDDPDEDPYDFAIAGTVTLPQSFSLTGPTSGTFTAGDTVAIEWTAGGIVPGSKVSLCYDQDTSWNGNEHWITIDQVDAADGTYSWDTTGVAAGSYYIAGYLFDFQGTSIFSHLEDAIAIGSPLVLIGEEILGANTAPLTKADLQPIACQAITDWTQTTQTAASPIPAWTTSSVRSVPAVEAGPIESSLAEQLDGLGSVSFVITDLAGTQLALAAGDTIYVDVNAAGHGWLIDRTPGIDEEFELSEGNLRALDPEAVDRVDLLTVLCHELGHVLGLEDLDPSADTLMSSQLAPRLRRSPGPVEIDALFAQG